MAKIEIATDSTADIPKSFCEELNISVLPLTILAGEKEYRDGVDITPSEFYQIIDASKTLPVSSQVASVLYSELFEETWKEGYSDLIQVTMNSKGSGTACPSVGDWLQAFGDAEEVYGVSLTSHLSGCYNAACIAAEEYMEEHPDRGVFILDSLSTGPELELLIEAGYAFEEIQERILEYLKQTHLLFSLESLSNFAKNGRVSPALAAAANLLGIRIVGRASDAGDLEPLHKCRGEKRAMKQLWECMQQSGYAGGKVRIRHSDNRNAAEILSGEILSSYPDADIQIGANRGLCSYYSEKGGILVGFESQR